MIPYDFSQTAREQIKKIPENDQKRIIEKVEFYLSTPNPLSFAKFVGRRNGIKVYRFRVGDWRIIFDWEDGKSIFITKIKLRKVKDIYRRF